MRPTQQRHEPTFPLILALAMTLVTAAEGCGNKAPSGNLIPTRDLSEAQRVAKLGAVNCADPQQCHEAVALLTEASPRSVGMCTAFLIAPDLMATNSHCIPDDLKKAGSDCRNRIWLRFPESAGHAGEAALCKTVLSASAKREITDPDYAFIRLDHGISRHAFTLDRQGLADGAQYIVTKFNPTSQSSPIGTIEQVHCKTPQRTLITPLFDSDWAPTATLADCTVTHGNSGAPVSDDSGKLRGLVQATVDPDELRQQMQADHRPALTSDRAALGVATNLACVRLPSDSAGAELPPACAELAARPGQPSGTPAASTALLHELEHEAQSLAATWSAGEPLATQHLAWTDASIQSDSPLERGLKSLRILANPPEGYRSVSPRCLKAPPNAATLEADLPLWEHYTGYNRYLQLGFKLTPAARSLHVRLSFDPAQLGHDSGPYTVTMTLNELHLPTQTLFDGAIPLCQ